MSNLRSKLFLLIGIVIFASILFSLVYTASKNPVYSDEYVFYKVSRELPAYSSSANWILVDNPDFITLKSEQVWGRDIIVKVYKLAYEKPVWVHPPLDSVLVYPFVKITDNIKDLRAIPITLTIGSLILLFLILRRRLSPILAAITISPVLLFDEITMFGGIYFYHEAFMLFFLILTIYLSEVKSRWKYVAGAALALSKLPAVAFLLPLMIKDRDWKYLLSATVIIPYWIATWVVGGSPFYLINHWLAMSEVARTIFWAGNILPQLGVYLIHSGLAAFIVIIIPSLYFAVKEKQYWLLVAALIAVVLGVGWAGIYYQMIEMVFLGIIALSYLVYHLNEYFQRPGIKEDIFSHIPRRGNALP